MSTVYVLHTSLNPALSMDFFPDNWRWLALLNNGILKTILETTFHKLLFRQFTTPPDVTDTEKIYMWRWLGESNVIVKILHINGSTYLSLFSWPSSLLFSTWHYLLHPNRLSQASCCLTLSIKKEVWVKYSIPMLLMYFNYIDCMFFQASALFSMELGKYLIFWRQ